MPFDDKTMSAQPHRLVLEDRRSLTISGVSEVESFDERSILLRCAQGALSIHGSDLHIEELSLDGGDLRVAGLIDALSYEDISEPTGSLLSRLFR